MTDDSQSPGLKKIRVLDLTRNIAGPYCTKLFAELSAEVIKIETPGAGDPARRIGPFLKECPYLERSALFSYLNTGKKGITLNIENSSGRKIFKNLLQDADVLVEDFEVGFMAAHGLGYRQLKEISPRLIMTSISDFGQTGPYKDWKSSDLVAFSMSGVSYSSFGTPERHPIKPYGSLSLHVVGLNAAVGTMMAIHSRERTGYGQYVDISLFECAVSLDAHQLPMLVYESAVRKRTNVLHPTTHPMTILRCKDGYVGFAIGTPLQWLKLCVIADLPADWFADGSPYLEGLYRRAHYLEINSALEPWLMSNTRDEIERAAIEVMLPANGVRNIAEIANDSQHRARAFFSEVSHPYGGVLTIPGMPFRMSRTAAQISRAPMLGEHNEEVLSHRLGYGPDQLVRLRGLGAI